MSSQLTDRWAPSSPPAPIGAITVDPSRSVNFFHVLRNRKLTLASCTVAGALLTALIVWRQPSMYQARVLLEMQGINENLLNSRDVDPTARLDNSSEKYINTEAQVLQSNPVYERVVQQLNAPDQWTGSVPWNPPISVAELEKSVKVRTHETDRILELWVESRDPRRAAAMANAIPTEFMQLDLESHRQANQRTSEWLATQLEDLGNKLRNSENDLQDFTKREDLLIDGNEGSVAESRLRQVQDELAHAQADRVAKQSVLQGVQGAPADAQAALLGDPTLQQYRLQLTALGKELAEMQAVYTPEYHKIPPLQAQIAVLQKAYDRQYKTVLEQIENDFHTAQRREGLLQAQYDTQFAATANQTAKMVRYNALKSAVDINRTIYQEILQKVKGYAVASAIQTSNVRVVEPAPIPDVPSRPNKPLITILGALGFLFAGAFWLLVKAAGDNSIQEPGEAEVFLQLPELGVIPSASADAGSYGTGRLGRRRLPPVETAAWSQSPSLLAESFRSASASLLLPRLVGKQPAVVLITSLNASEGKTTVASNLGIALTGVSRRVLLIDADRRRPRLHSIFGRRNERGLCDLLEAEPGAPLDDFIVDTAVPNLFVLPSGKATQATPDLLYSKKMSSIIAQCRREFDLVVIDTPPVLNLPDARILGRLSDGVILVMRAGRVHSRAIVAGERRLRMDGVPVMGTILNDWNPKTNGYGVYPTYDYV
jgi:succinoglycan biosynthesis transport protein ExoP